MLVRGSLACDQLSAAINDQMCCELAGSSSAANSTAYVAARWSAAATYRAGCAAFE